MPPESPESRESGKRRPEPSPWALAGAGFEFGAVVAVLALLGWWLDGKWGTRPWLLLVGVSVGVSGGLYKLWRTGKRFFEG